MLKDALLTSKGHLLNCKRASIEIYTMKLYYTEDYYLHQRECHFQILNAITHPLGDIISTPLSGELRV